MNNSRDIIGSKFDRLEVIEKLEQKHQSGQSMYKCKCDCGNYTDVMISYLTTEQTRSCGCLKEEQNQINLREQYENKRIDGVVMPLFKGKKPRKDSSIGYRGVSKYYTRKSKELRYRAWLTVNGKHYYKSGFKTPEEAYFNGRLYLEKEHLPLDSKENK